MSKKLEALEGEEVDHMLELQTIKRHINNVCSGEAHRARPSCFTDAELVNLKKIILDPTSK